MIYINLIGGGFQHDFSSTNAKKPKYFEYIKNKFESNISLYVDSSIMSGVKERNINFEKIKLAFISESKSIFNTDIIKNNYEKVIESYDYIFTHDQELLKLDNKFKFIHANGFWIKEPKIYNKTNLISMITSNKLMIEGHVNRIKTFYKFKNKLDYYGRGFKEIQFKEEGLCNYMFSIVMENAKYDDYFTEKILDCFATGTIPIYYGTNNISNYFNKDGIITLTNDFKIEDLSSELYYSKLDAIKDNLERVIKYEVAEDIIYEKYLKYLL
jgi:uncharacterized protein YutD